MAIHSSRDPAAVLDNVLDGLFSPEIAREHYGVVIAGGTVDAAATEQLRQLRRPPRPRTLRRRFHCRH